MNKLCLSISQGFGLDLDSLPPEIHYGGSLGFLKMCLFFQNEKDEISTQRDSKVNQSFELKLAVFCTLDIIR